MTGSIRIDDIDYDVGVFYSFVIRVVSIDSTLKTQASDLVLFQRLQTTG